MGLEIRSLVRKRRALVGLEKRSLGSSVSWRADVGVDGALACLRRSDRHGAEVRYLVVLLLAGCSNSYYEERVMTPASVIETNIQSAQFHSCQEGALVQERTSRLDDRVVLKCL